MNHDTLTRRILSTGVLLTLVACEPPERLSAPARPLSLICEDLNPCDPPPDPPPSGVIGRFGLVIHQNVERSNPTHTTPELDELLRLHVNLVRLEVDWGKAIVDTRTTAYQWGPNQAAMLTRQGIDVLANVTYRYSLEPYPAIGTTHCAGHPAKACIPSDSVGWMAFYGEWVSYVNQLVANNQNVKYWSAWNEPNDTETFNGRPTQYDSLARALCDAVWATGNGQLRCVGPDLAVHRPFQTTNVGNDWDWLRARMNAVNFDIISIHWYEWLDDVKTKVSYVKSQYPGKPVWVTETGMPDPTYRWTAADPEFQERDLVAKWLDLRSGSGPIDALFYFDLQSVENGITQDFNPRPAYFALKRLNEGSYGAAPIPGNCSNADGNGLCEYTSWIPPEYGCRVDYYVRDRAGQPVRGATILARATALPPYLQRVVDLGNRQTNAAGVASFTAHCGWPQSAHFVYGGSPYSADSPTLSVSESNRVAVYTFYLR
jgi:hypothetical protein